MLLAKSDPIILNDLFGIADSQTTRMATGHIMSINKSLVWLMCPLFRILA
jgi:hypothetical protein